ncbi:MAG: DUF4404 family protein [Acidimicrobiales bacterium]
MDARLRALIAELDEAISAAEADGNIDDDERYELLGLVAQVERALVDPNVEDNTEDDGGGLVSRLELAAVEFEYNHPRLAAAIQSAANTLSSAGI